MEEAQVGIVCTQEPVEYDEAGQLCKRYRLKNKLDGEVFVYDQDGWLIQKNSYKNGQLHGKVMALRKVGNSLFVFEHDCQNALDSGNVNPLQPAFEKSGHMLTNEAVVHTIVVGCEWFLEQFGQSYTIRKVTQQLCVYPGRVVQLSDYRHGKLDGETRLFNDQGQVVQQIQFKAGLMDGEMTLYLNGQKQTIVHYKGGKQDGPMTAYYKDGQKQTAVNYKDGKQEGQSVSYYPNGKESLISYYSHEELHGEQFLKYDTGELFKKSYYEHGKLQGKVSEYFPTGKIMKESCYKDNKLHGKVYVYNEKGKLKEKSYYQNGVKIGHSLKKSRMRIFS